MTERTRTPRSNDASTFRPRFVRRRHRDGRCRQRRRPAAGSRSHRVSTRKLLRLFLRDPSKRLLSGDHRLGVRQIGPESSERARVARAGADGLDGRLRGVWCGSNRGWTARQVASLGVDNPHRVRPSVRSAFGGRHLESMPAISLPRSTPGQRGTDSRPRDHLEPVEQDPNRDCLEGTVPQPGPPQHPSVLDGVDAAFETASSG